jgi:general secretion pathway protein F
MTFVVPKVVDQFTDMGQELPGITMVMIAISDFMRTFGPVLLIGIVAGGIAFAQGLRGPAFKRKVDNALLRLPIVGRLIRNLQTARFARTLSTLIASGCSVVESLRAAEQILRNRIFKEAVADISTQVVEGASLSSALKRSKAFPPMIAYMAASGENSGKLDEMMGKCADYLEREFEDFTAAALSLLEPAIIILMGGVVATIVLSILMPILKLNTLAMT